MIPTATRIPLPPFELHQPIGRGGMGEIWRGSHKGHDLSVVAKVLTNELFQQQLYNEVHKVARLDHPNIVAILDYGHVDEAAAQASGGRLIAGTPYFVMEHMSGGSLDQHLKGGVDWPFVEEILGHLLDALAHAHAHGVLHRDLKPANVLIGTQSDTRPGVKLTDFGLALTFAEREAGLPMGTPLYMAPEQFEQGRLRELGPPTDLYALGCVAWELVTGNPPFLAPHSTDRRAYLGALRSAHRDLALPSLPATLCAIPPAFESWLRRMLAKDPTDRFECAADARHALRCLGPPSDPAARRPSAPPSSSGPPSPTPFPARVTWSDFSSWSPEPEVELMARQPSPMVPSWRTGTPDPARLRLLGAGLQLYPLRHLPLVGRVAERDRLWGLLGEAWESRSPRLVLIEGPPGYGKRRLADWLVTRAAELGVARACTGSHLAGGGPEQGLAEALAQALGCAGLTGPALDSGLREALEALDIKDDWSSRVLSRFLEGELDEAAGDAPGFPDPGRPRQRLIARILARLSAQRPLVLCLNGAQWGSGSLRFIDHLFTEPEGAAVLVVLGLETGALAERPVERALLQALQTRGPACALPLEPLPPREAEDLVHSLLPLEPGLARRVARHCGGIPELAVRAVGQWVQQDLLQLGPDGFGLRAGAVPTLPDNLVQAWAHTLTAVLAPFPPAARTCLWIAAALGPELQANEWTEVCRRQGLELPPGLIDALVRSDILRPRRGAWLLRDRVLRDTLRHDAGGRWEELHQACLSVLEERPAGPRAEERLGRHQAELGQAEAALPHLLAGALGRLNLSSYHETLDLVDLARRLAEPLGHRPPGSMGHLDLIEARALIGLGRFAEAAALADRTIVAARRAQQTALEAEAFHYRGMVAQKQGALPLAEALFRQARWVAEQHGHGRWLARSTYHLGIVARSWGEVETAASLLRQAEAAFAEMGDVYGQADALAALGDTFVGTAEGEALTRQAIALFATIDNAFGLAACQNTLGDRLRYLGRLDEARQAYQEALVQLDRILSQGRIFPLLNLALLDLQQDRVEDARQRFEEGRQLAIDGRRQALESYAVAGLLCCLLHHEGPETEGSRLLDRLDALLSTTGQADRDLAWLLERAAIEAHRRDRGELAQRCGRLLQNLGRGAQPPSSGS